MYELYPYHTNDGSVGLFSPQDDDIYHSTYGALTESWQKFIVPSRFEQYLSAHEEVKILDICYGIGYNTKTSLNVFIKNALNFLKNKKINLDLNNNIATIDTDNNSRQKRINTKKISCIKFDSKNFDGREMSRMICYHIEAIDTHNIASAKINQNESDNPNLDLKAAVFCKKILIDAVDIDKILINLSPFISTKTKDEKFLMKKVSHNSCGMNNSNDKLQQIEKMKNASFVSLPSKFKLRQEVPIIILEKLLKSNPNYLNEPYMQVILNQKKYSPFLSKFMLNLAKLYHNHGYNHNKKLNKSAFLHNIYYRYISKSYKNVEKLLKHVKIDLNLLKDDARHFVKTTNHKYNFIFLDAFTPAKCPTLWTLEFFKELNTKLEDDGMVLTYSCSAAIRNAFLQNGFYVGKIIDSNSKKQVGTIASKLPTSIENLLDERDMALIKSRAGICYRDSNLECDNQTIISNREKEVMQSELMSSSKAIKGDYSAKPL